MIPYFRRKLNPTCYQGRDNQPQHFEGWYFKIVDKEERHPYVIIPGIFISRTSADTQAFIQIFDGNSNQAHYHPFPIDDFRARDYQFDVHISFNRFSADCISLNIKNTSFDINGELTFNALTPWPKNIISPGIMGWYTWMPFMECYHGIVSLDHDIQGSLTINGQIIDFTSGKGYIEKDWGQSFPNAWIWCQSNHFDANDVSITGSIAIIPWIRRPFLGYIFGLWHEHRLYRFTTYTGAQLVHFEMNDSRVSWALKQKQYTLEIVAQRAEGGFLHAPTLNGMTHRISESLQSILEVTLSEKTGIGSTTIFHDIGRCAGFEIAGDTERLVDMYSKQSGIHLS